MAIKLKDLEKTEKELLKLIENANKQLEAIRVLKESTVVVRPKSTTAVASALDPTISISGRKRGTLNNAIKEEIKKMGDEWFSPRQITERLVESGIRSRNQWNSLRATVSTTLRNIAENGELNRRNIKPEGKSEYEYAKKDSDQLL